MQTQIRVCERCEEEQKSYLRGKRYRHEKKPVGGDGSNQHTSNEETVSQLQSTAERLATEYGVSDKTIKNPYCPRQANRTY
jgi:hypothetical protein